MVAEELLNKSAAMVTLESEDFVSDGPLKLNTTSGAATVAIDLNRIQLTDSDPAMLDGADNEAARISLKIIIRMVDIMGARELMDVLQAHIDGAWYGPGSVAFGKRLRDLGGKFKVPTTIHSLNIDQKCWRALGVNAEFDPSAFATTSSAPIFHMVNLTPEAPTLEAVCCYDAIWDEFNYGSEPRGIDLISFGNPYFSPREIKEVAKLCQGRIMKDNFAVIVTCGRAQYSLALETGYIRELERYGDQFLQDTSWCSIREPVIPKNTRTVMTNSDKSIHYGPGLTGKQFAFGNLEMCINAACKGKTTGEPPSWLLEARSR
ncbi:hypothetical protein AARAC_006318 [Aspergillus arachidicola]|uniref:Phosphomevalonate dehydratase large subunit-like domain-containing protein n=1 Tax=Aspergillus arachidicola TaxID=656916 RepID=A0A2G7FUR8_9EURO|nr:hypothetical protein AARAC_006318 [Aspergillus arachidicola]